MQCVEMKGMTSLKKWKDGLGLGNIHPFVLFAHVRISLREYTSVAGDRIYLSDGV